jgi:hypothetical protein
MSDSDKDSEKQESKNRPKVDRELVERLLEDAGEGPKTALTLAGRRIRQKDARASFLQTTDLWAPHGQRSSWLPKRCARGPLGRLARIVSAISEATPSEEQLPELSLPRLVPGERGRGRDRGRRLGGAASKFPLATGRL